MQPRDRFALDSGVKQPIVDISECQHRGVGAGALNRQIATARVIRSARWDATLRVDPADPSRGAPANHEVAPKFTSLVMPPPRKALISVGERLQPGLWLH
jgi:hypothetical protein